MKTIVETKNSHAIDNCKAKYEDCISLVKLLDAGGEYDNEVFTADEARERIEGMPLSIGVRCSEFRPIAEPLKADEYEILLSTGGPACRITGDLDEHGQADSAQIQWQDWGTLWTDWNAGSIEDDKLLLHFAQQFYFGE